MAIVDASPSLHDMRESPLHITIAIVLAVLASGCFALGATFQHRAVEHTVDADDVATRALGMRRIMALLRRPLWFGGLALIVVGAVMHVAALNMAPLTVIQPLGILAVPISVLLTARHSGVRPSARIWGSVLVTIGGVAAFTGLSSMHAVHDPVIDAPRIVRMALVVWVAAIIIVLGGRTAPYWLRCMAWASAGAVLYGLGSAFIKLMTMVWTNGSGPVHPVFWGSGLALLASYVVGGWMVQSGYATGPAEIVVGAMTTIDPFVAVLFGLIVLGEGALTSPAVAAGMTLAGAIAAAGVVLLSRYHPDAGKSFAQLEGEPGEGTARK